MKKILVVLILCLFLSRNAYAAEFSTFDSKEDNTPEETMGKYLPFDKVVRDNFKNLTVADIISQYPRSLQQINSSGGVVQYVFFVKIKEVDRSVPVVCFVTAESTTCRVP